MLHHLNGIGDGGNTGRHRQASMDMQREKRESQFNVIYTFESEERERSKSYASEYTAIDCSESHLFSTGTRRTRTLTEYAMRLHEMTDRLRSIYAHVCVNAEGKSEARNETAKKR